jgi:hypothetical protein
MEKWRSIDATQQNRIGVQLLAIAAERVKQAFRSGFRGWNIW